MQEAAQVGKQNESENRAIRANHSSSIWRWSEETAHPDTLDSTSRETRLAHGHYQQHSRSSERITIFCKMVSIILPMAMLLRLLVGVKP
jgi:hypothetical protein